MAWDDVKNFLGEALGDASLFLRPVSHWGEIPDVIAKRQQEVEKPGVSRSLIGSPFRAGFLGVGGKDVGGKFQPDIPPPQTNYTLHHLTDENGKPIPGAFVDPVNGKFFKGGWDLDAVMTKAKELGFDTSQFQPSGFSAGPFKFARKPGAVPPPPAGYDPVTQVYDPKSGTWHPGTAKKPGADKGAKGVTRQQAIDMGLDPDALGIEDTAPATTRTPTTTGPAPVPPTMTPASKLPPGPLPGKPQAFVFHHTGGEGDVAGVEHTLQQRHLGVQYVMDRDGQIFTTTTLPGQQQMQRGSGAGAGLSNANTVGMEIIAKDDADVTLAQRAAAKKFIEDHYPNTPVYGHGEVNPGHKQPTEGMSVVNDIRTARGQQPKSRLGPSGGAPAAPGAPSAQPGTKLLNETDWLAANPGAEIHHEHGQITVTRRAAPLARPKAPVAEKPASPKVVEEIGQLKVLDDGLGDLEGMLQSPDITSRLGPVRGRAAWVKYKLGGSTDPLFDHFQTMEDLIGNLSVGRLARQSGSRSYIVWQALSAHKPQAGDDPELTKSKVQTLRNLVRHTNDVALSLEGVPASKLREALANVPDLPEDQIVDPDIRTALRLPPLQAPGGPQTPTTGGPPATTTTTAPPTTTTTLPGGDAQKAFDEHLNQWRTPQQVPP